MELSWRIVYIKAGLDRPFLLLLRQDTIQQLCFWHDFLKQDSHLAFTLVSAFSYVRYSSKGWSAQSAEILLTR